MASSQSAYAQLVNILSVYDLLTSNFGPALLL